MLRTFRRVLSACLVLTGVGLLAWVLGPLAYSYARLNLDPAARLIDPSAASRYPIPVVINAFGVASTDYTQAANWFIAPPPSTASASRVSYFSLSYPRLKLFDVPIEVNGSDLRRNPIHFTGTSLPGTFGNTVIFGHSALPQFYQPENPLTIFNPLLQAEVGDEISVNYDGVTYRYQVKNTAEVKPTQVEVLAQRFDHHELTLITCVPLGTYWKRFVVRAELTN